MVRFQERTLRFFWAVGVRHAFQGMGHVMRISPEICPSTALTSPSSSVPGASAPDCAHALKYTPQGTATCPSDLNGDGVVDGQDLAVVLGAWGLPCDG